MSKYKVIIKYYNKGKKISEMVTTLPLEEITQERINIALRLILQIHLQQPPHEAVAKVTQGRNVLKEISYTGDPLEGGDPDNPQEYK